MRRFDSPVGNMDECDDGEYVRHDDAYSWDGLMSVLDAIYPASVFTGVSGDIGPLIIVKLREIDALRRGPTGPRSPDGD